jgi:anti-sigma factor RsiW
MHERCRDLLEALSLHIDGETSAALCREFERHLADCADCQIVVNTLKKTLELYRQGLPIDSIPVDVRARLFAVLDREGMLPPSSSQA